MAAVAVHAFESSGAIELDIDTVEWLADDDVGMLAHALALADIGLEATGPTAALAEEDEDCCTTGVDDDDDEACTCGLRGAAAGSQCMKWHLAPLAHVPIIKKRHLRKRVPSG